MDPSEWCTQEYLNRFVKGELAACNKLENYAFLGPIDSLELEPSGRLRIALKWQAVAVDEFGKPNVNGTTWIEISNKAYIYSLFSLAGAPDDRPSYFRVATATKGELLLDGRHSCLDETITLREKTTLDRAQVQPADPSHPVLFGKTAVKGLQSNF